MEWREGVNPVQDVVRLRDDSKGDALEPAAWMLRFLGASTGTQGTEHYCERARATFVRDTNEEQPAGETGEVRGNPGRDQQTNVCVLHYEPIA